MLQNMAQSMRLFMIPEQANVFIITQIYGTQLQTDSTGNVHEHFMWNPIISRAFKTPFFCKIQRVSV